MYTQRLKSIFNKQYEYRNQSQHKQAVQFLQPYFSTLSSNTIKLITFYTHIIEANSSIDRKLQHGILLTITSSEENTSLTEKIPEIIRGYMIVKNEQLNLSEKDSFALHITYDNYLSCLALGQTTIEEELQFFHMSEYLCSMPRKKYFSILRNSKVLSFTHRQQIYFEEQLISPGQSGSGVYLVRHGQLVYIKKINQQNVQVYRFVSGHLLGNLQTEARQQKRLFSVKCKSGRVIVYQLSQQFFSSFIKPYCQAILIKKQLKLQKFLTQKSSKLSEFREGHKQFNLSLRRSISNVNDIEKESKSFGKMTNVNMFTSRDLPTLIKTSRNSVDIESDELRKTSYNGLRFDGALKNYPKTLQKSKFLQSEFGELKRLQQKNEKITKIRTIKNIQSDQTRESIMFSLFQNSWKFQKQRKRRQY